MKQKATGPIQKNKSLHTSEKGSEYHAAFTSDKKNDFNVPVPLSSQISSYREH